MHYPCIHPAKGTVTIGSNENEGKTFAQKNTLTATNTIVDPDGTKSITYEWKRVNTQDKTEETIGDDRTAYTLVQADVGHKIKVVVTHVDQSDNSQVFTSDETQVIENANDTAVGKRKIFTIPLTILENND